MISRMTTKPPQQKILQRILHTENESIQNQERTGSTKPQEKKRQEKQRQLNERNHHLPFSTNTERYRT
jgi:hypothetical protein